MILTFMGWIAYAYKNPNSPSGLWLIDHRPSKIIEMVSTRLPGFKKDSNNLTRLEEQSA
jgi:hypothetical protein